MGNLNGKTVFISGASRGIGKAIALKAARDGANIVIAAKTVEPDPRIPGTIHSAAAEMVAAGGQALALQVDVRSEESVQKAVEATVAEFGGVDVLVNNASAIGLTGTQATPMKRFDLMHQINTRGTFLCSQMCIPHLKKADNPHVLNLSPPLNLEPRWFAPHVAYTMAKYGMSMCVLGMAEEFRKDGIAFNALWPRTLIATVAVLNLPGGGAEIAKKGRKPEIMADAAHTILCRDSRQCTGNFFVDEKVLQAGGIEDFSHYKVDPDLPEAELFPDFFL